MSDFFTKVLDHLAVWPWWAVAGSCFWAAFLEMVFPPLPGQVFVVAAGALIGARGFALLLPVGIAFVLGTFLGGCVDFFVGQKAGKALLNKPLVLRIFPLQFQEKAHLTVTKHGEWAMAVAKFIPGIGALVVVLCGIMGMPRRKAVTWLAAIAILHTGLFLGFGVGVGAAASSLLTRDIKTALWITGALLVGFGVLWVFRRRAK